MATVMRRCQPVRLALLALAECFGSAAAANPNYNSRPMIEAGDAGDTLHEFSKQTGFQLYFTPELVQHVKTRPVAGTLKPKQALSEMLAETELGFHFVNAETVVITSRRKPGPVSDPLSPQVVVHGKCSALDWSLIEGHHVSASDIEITGLNTIQDVLRTYPWVSRGACDDDLANVIREARTNSTLACGLNQRDLGPGSTVVLINGQRIAYGGTAALFGDISHIPLSAIERLDITLDGSSTVYGADAVAGVANFILRRDFEGMQTQARWAPAIGGRVGEEQFSQTLGKRWSFGNGSASFEYYRREALPAADRRQGTSNLLPWGGTDRGTVFGTPPNVAIGSRIWTLMPVQNSVPTPADFIERSPTLFDTREATDLLPRQTRVGASLAGNIDVTPLTQIFGDALITWRGMTDNSAAQGLALTITPDNPFYVNPTGGIQPETVYYGFLHALGPTTLNNSVWNGDVAVGATTQLGAGWKMKYSVGYSFETQDEIVGGLYNPDSMATALASMTAATAFNPFGPNSASLLQSISSQSKFRSTSGLERANVTTRGSLSIGWLGDVDIVTGVDYRGELFDSLEQAKSYAPAIAANTHRNVTAVFGQFCIPFTGHAVSTCGDRDSATVEQPQLTVGGRYEHFTGFGGHLTPTLKLLWSPERDLSLEGTWSLSSKPPGLADLSEADNVSQIVVMPNSSSPSQISSALRAETPTFDERRPKRGP